MLNRLLLTAILLIVSVLPQTPAMATTGCQFITSPSTPTAFCEDLSGGASPGGRAGDLSDARWSVSRMVGDLNANNLISFPPVPVEQCKSGVTQVISDNDILICDSASGHSGQFETAMKAQNYAMMSLRPRQAFDFTGRTGTISFNVDAITQGEGSWWPSVYITDQPSPGAINSSEVVGMLPTNGIGFDFNNNCSVTNASQTKVDTVYVYTNLTESLVPLTGTQCFTTSRGHLNHIEIQVSASHVAVWASDFSPDNVTFPNFRQVASANLSVPLTHGYVHFQEYERAPIKNETGYYTPGYANNYWSDLAFDGPVVGQETDYTAPDALTVNPSPVGDAGNATGAVNIGYGILDNPNSMYACCDSGGNRTTVASLQFSGVSVAGIQSALLTFSVTFTYTGTASPSTVKLHYSLNGGPAQTPSQPNYAGEQTCSDCPGPTGGNGVPYIVNVNPASLVNGTNTLFVSIDNGSNNYPPVLANVDLVTSGSGGTPTSTPTSTATATSTTVPTATPAPTMTAIPTDTPVPTVVTTATPTTTPIDCQVDVKLNGVELGWQAC